MVEYDSLVGGLQPYRAWLAAYHDTPPWRNQTHFESLMHCSHAWSLFELHLGGCWSDKLLRSVRFEM